MIPASDIASAKAAIVDIIGADVPLRRKGNEFCALCPFHQEKSPSFYVVPAKGIWHCFGCGATGDAIGYVMRTRNLKFDEAVREILGGVDRLSPAEIERKESQRAASEAEKAERDAAYIRKILQESTRDLDRTAADLYLQMRGLRPSPELLAHPGLWCAETRQEYPALIAPIRSSQGEITALQRIWVLPRVEYDATHNPKDSRPPIITRKKCVGHMGDGAVRLWPVHGRDEMGVAEGVETALAARQLYRMPVWALCGLHRLGEPAGDNRPGRAPAVRIPSHIRRLVIFGDNGDVGHRIADYAAWWWRRHGLQTTAVYPELKFDDFNSQLMG